MSTAEKFAEGEAWRSIVMDDILQFITKDEMFELLKWSERHNFMFYRQIMWRLLAVRGKKESHVCDGCL